MNAKGMTMEQVTDYFLGKHRFDTPEEAEDFEIEKALHFGGMPPREGDEK